MKENLLSSYSFLASLNENGTDLYKAVYIPMCKRALSLFAKEHSTGKDENIQAIIRENFSIDIPLLVTRKLIHKVSDDLSRRDKGKFDFKIFEDGKSFQFKSFAFNKIEECYEREKRNANALQLAFETFLKEKETSIKETPTFSSFILRYKNRLSSFLSGKTISLEGVVEEESYMVHARFLQFIEKNNDELYKVVKRVFVGSLIASYLESEMDISAKAENKINYYLDSKIVLEALDLQGEESTKPTQELLRLIKSTGGNIRVLDVTVAEIHSIIDAAIQRFNKDTPTTTINEACVRNVKSKTWLLKLNGNLENILSEQLQADISKVPETDIKKYSESDDVKQLKKIWFRKNAAEHDVIAYLYVRERRKQDTNKKLYQKASSWFISENSRLLNFNIERKLNGNANEVILPQELTSLLFLQNPQKYSPQISNIGLNELISQTLTDEYPSRDIINEFDTAIQENVDVTDAEYEYIASEISQYSTIQLQKLVEQSVSNPESFKSSIHSIIANTKKKKSAEEEKRRKQREIDEQEKNNLRLNNQELIQKMAAISQQLSDLRTTVEDEKKKKAKTQKYLKVSAIIAFVTFCIIVLVQHFASIEETLNILLDWIKSAGGLWAFGNLIWNVITKIRKK